MSKVHDRATDEVAASKVAEALARRSPTPRAGTMSEAEALAEKAAQAKRVADDNARLRARR